MKAIKITFKEPAHLRIFTDEMIAGPSGPNREVDVENGEIWCAPTSQGNALSEASRKKIPVENNSWGLFHDLGCISRTTEEPALWTQIAAVNQVLGIVPHPLVPHYEAEIIDFTPADTTHEDYLYSQG